MLMRERLLNILEAAWGISLGVLQVLAVWFVLIFIGRLLLGLPM